MTGRNGQSQKLTRCCKERTGAIRDAFLDDGKSDLDANFTYRKLLVISFTIMEADSNCRGVISIGFFKSVPESR